MQTRIPMTPAGFEKVAADLRRHKEILKPNNIRDIEEAREHGDIKENSEFADAKDRQALIDGRIREMESKLSMADVIDITKIRPSDLVIFGVTVELEDVNTEEKLTYRIVGTEEADVRKGLISYSSPIGTALIGRKLDDEVKVVTPKGERFLTITAVHYR